MSINDGRGHAYLSVGHARSRGQHGVCGLRSWERVPVARVDCVYRVRAGLLVFSGCDSLQQLRAGHGVPVNERSADCGLHFRDV